MSIVLAVALAILGWFAGSALWVVVRAIAANRSPVSGPACFACSAPMPAAAWMPLSGFGRGRVCRSCQAPLDPLRPLFEFAALAYFAAAGVLIDDGLRLTAALAFAIPLATVALLDIWLRQVFSNLIALGIMLGVGVAALEGLYPLWRSFLGLLAGAGIVAIFHMLCMLLYENRQRAPVGPLDIFVAGMIGAMVRWPLVLTALAFGSVLAALAGIVLLILMRDRPRRRLLYGPFLCLGSLAVLLIRF